MIIPPHRLLLCLGFACTGLAPAALPATPDDRDEIHLNDLIVPDPHILSDAESIACSAKGKLEGPGRHEPAPILQDDVGHGSVFTAFDGRLPLVIHKCFRQAATRVQIYELEEFPNRIQVKRPILGTP